MSNDPSFNNQLPQGNQPPQGYVPPQQPGAPPPQGYAPPPQGYAPPPQGYAPPPKPKSKLPMILGIIGGIALLAVCGCVGFMYMAGRNLTLDEDTASSPTTAVGIGDAPTSVAFPTSSTDRPTPASGGSDRPTPASGGGGGGGGGGGSNPPTAIALPTTNGSDDVSLVGHNLAGSIANERLQRGVLKTMKDELERTDCTLTVLNVDLVSPKDSAGEWVEKWKVMNCDGDGDLTVTFTPVGSDTIHYRITGTRPSNSGTDNSGTDTTDSHNLSGTLADNTLRRDIVKALENSMATSSCPLTVLNVDVIEKPDNTKKWVEEWMVMNCNGSSTLTITFTPASTGGTDYRIEGKAPGQ